jgi:hypothetical protein
MAGEFVVNTFTQGKVKKESDEAILENVELLRRFLLPCL